MRAAAILRPGLSASVIDPFRQKPADIFMGLPATSAQADAVLIFGGDGTLHRYLSELVNLKLPTLMVPLGSGNDFARALNLQRWRDSLKLWRQFSSNRSNVRMVDLGTITPVVIGCEKPKPQYFSSVAGIGLDAEVARRANELPSCLRGHGGYLLSLIPVLLSFSAFEMKIMSFEASGWKQFSSKPTLLAAVANTPSYGGGIRIAPCARIDDNQLDICVLGSVNRLRRLRLFPTVYSGKHLQAKEVGYFAAERVRLETEKPSAVYADGEYVCETPVEIAVMQSALKVIVAS
jgi:diacylglycerol kinase (ATP)